MTNSPETEDNDFTVHLHREREMRMNTIYGVLPTGIVAYDRLYLNTLAVRQRFCGQVPVHMTMTLTEVPPKK